ncbi:DUF1015 domain-containing protein [Streptomyces montanisoli]|uniref:DUF1015 domain-containing protein n=1 Tax=Streptomyces montanisoli TaxID=2798581 RepID=A0A940RVF8_9ACTN|nr:DUF1015 domain-containing protein [Streptomyces montanisoli]MBP0456053.1 DUF1015 domain-containing protein [Streptomyces montanisoli]
MSLPGLPAHTPVPLRPFRGVRYAPTLPGTLSSVVSPPFDEIGPAQARALRCRPHHIARLLHDRDPLAAADQLTRWLQRGVLRRDPRPALYVYEQHAGRRRVQRGLIGELDWAGHTPGPVLPHEDVDAHLVVQRASMLRALRAQLEPLLLTHRTADGTGTQAADRLTQRPPTATVRIGTMTHRLWACTDPDEQTALTVGLAGRRFLMADGHHRHAACLRLHEQEEDPSPWRHALALLVDSTNLPLRLTAIHRVIPGLEVDKAAAAAADIARVRPLPAGAFWPAPGEVVIAGAGRAWAVTEPDPTALQGALAGCPPQWQQLPTAVADRLLLAHAWSVSDLGCAVQYVHDAEQAIAAVAANGSGTAVLLPSITEDTVRGFATAGVCLPRKTTSFWPKPAAGLVLRVPECG